MTIIYNYFKFNKEKHFCSVNIYTRYLRFRFIFQRLGQEHDTFLVFGLG